MKLFYITSTITIEAESREELARILDYKNEEQKEKFDGIMFDLIRNAEIYEAPVN